MCSVQIISLLLVAGSRGEQVFLRKIKMLRKSWKQFVIKGWLKVSFQHCYLFRKLNVGRCPNKKVKSVPIICKSIHLVAYNEKEILMKVTKSKT